MKRYLSLVIFVSFVYAGLIKGQPGRILFVDTIGIEKTDLQRIHHLPLYYSGNPVLKADKQWELNINGDPYAALSAAGYGMTKRIESSRCGILPVVTSY